MLVVVAYRVSYIHISLAVGAFRIGFHCEHAFWLQWLKLTSDDVKEQIYKLAKKGLTPSQIGSNFLFFFSM